MPLHIRKGVADTCLIFENMRSLAGGSFLMGSESFYEEEKPVRRVRVDPFFMDETPVTNAQYAAFVNATGYRTLAELTPDPLSYPNLDPEAACPGALVFQPTPYPIVLDDWSQWWSFVPGACWSHPTGPESDLTGLQDHPVVQIAYADAEAYAKWAGKALPTEAEWEYAAKGTSGEAAYAWGDDFMPDGQLMANIWQGVFPCVSPDAGRKFRTSPVGSFPSNGFGLLDMIGNVWEWTRDWYALPQTTKKSRRCCEIINPRGALMTESYDPSPNQPRIGRKVLKGGSHLCSPSYCYRYRPAARIGQMIDSGTSHISFRCVVRQGK